MWKVKWNVVVCVQCKTIQQWNDLAYSHFGYINHSVRSGTQLFTSNCCFLHLWIIWQTPGEMASSLQQSKCMNFDFFWRACWWKRKYSFANNPPVKVKTIFHTLLCVIAAVGFNNVAAAGGVVLWNKMFEQYVFAVSAGWAVVWHVECVAVMTLSWKCSFFFFSFEGWIVTVHARFVLNQFPKDMTCIVVLHAGYWCARHDGCLFLHITHRLSSSFRWLPAFIQCFSIMLHICSWISFF